MKAFFLALLILMSFGIASGYTHTESLIKWREYSQGSFDIAEKTGKPIFMLVTAAWCYNCRIYEEKSLEAKEVADYINAEYIPIFLDYDKRRDIGDKYIIGGVPTTVIFAPDGEKLIAVPGYIPKESLLESLETTTEFIREEYESTPVAEEEREGIGAISIPTQTELEIFIQNNEDIITLSYDDAYGGLFLQEQSVKFTFPRLLDYMLDLYVSTGDEEWLNMVTNTLDHMAGIALDSPERRETVLGFEELSDLYSREGVAIDEVNELQSAHLIVGIYDDFEGGFFRYSTRRDWTQPHFEKMLDENALLIRLYLRAFEITGKSEYKEIAVNALQYTIENLYEGSSFYGSQKASEVYYHFSPTQRMQVKAPEFDMTRYADWNAEMAITLFQASKILGDDVYRNVAENVLGFLKDKLIKDNGVQHYYDEEKGTGVVDGLLTDNSLVPLAFMEGHKATGKQEYLDTAVSVLDYSERHLYDGEYGGFFERNSTSLDFYLESELFSDDKPFIQNGIMAYTLIQAYEATGEARYLNMAKVASGYFVDEKVFLTDTAYDNLAYPLKAARYLARPVEDVTREPKAKDYTFIPRLLIVALGLIWIASLVYRKLKK